MNDDPLQRAADVVRERYDGESELAARSELRLLAAFDHRTRRARRAPLFVIPLVAALVGSAAWGLGSARLRALVHLVGTAASANSPTTPENKAHIPASRFPAPSPNEPTRAPPEPARVEPLAVPESLPATPVRALVPSVRPSPRVPAASAPSASAQPAEPASAAPSASEISDLYRAAHHAQFSGSDPAQALLLWDRYLAAAPNGALSPEARYNRAIALARLGRKTEAATALEPFARGDYGGYRKSEAASLLDVLRPSAR